MNSIHRLLARFPETVTAPGRYADGGGLYLLVRRRGEALERLWLFRYTRGPRGAQRECTLSLGPARDVSLALARELAAKARTALIVHQDLRTALRPPVAPTFGELADDYVDSIAPGLRNAKHISQWRMTLGDAYCRKLRPIPVDRITTNDIVATLRRTWVTKPETTKRLRARIEKVLDAATVRGMRSGPNPAHWKGHLELLLPKPKTLARGHHAALPWAEMPAFMARLRALESMSALALEWTILTAARTGETIGATWSEVDRDAGVWTVPAERMKAKLEHRVPLCDRCLLILSEVAQLGGKHLFPSWHLHAPLSNMAMAQCLKGLQGVNGTPATVHGFRSSFRDWVGEQTTFPERLAEIALAHAVGNKTERAYRRGDALERRRMLMQAWATFLDTGMVDNVVPFARAGSTTSGTDRGE